MQGSRSKGEILQKLKDSLNLVNEDFSDVDLSNIDFTREGVYGLHGARLLRRANFSKANLSDVNFTQTILDNANFSNAILRRADFTEARLQHADFCSADLWAANFFLADLRGADLRGADLADSYLERANLEGANLQGAIFNSETVLPDGSTWDQDIDLEQYTRPLRR